MKKWCLLLGLLVVFAGLVRAQEEYPLGPDSQRQAGVPQGTVTKYTWTSKIFPGTVRDYWVYVPAQYDSKKPACVMVFQDGSSYVKEDGPARIPIVFDNLIAKHDMPVTIAILIDPGTLKAAAPGQQDRVNRSYEYDGMSDRFARFLLNEILPEVAKHYNLSTNPNDRAISGGSSGGICSFTVAWTHPEAFRRVLSFIGSYTDLRGGDVYPALIRKTEPKPIRVFLQDGNHDLNNFAGDWWLANQSMASALTFAGYDVKFVTGDKDHDMIQGGAIMPDALRWLWRDYPQPIAKPAMRALGDPKSGFAGVDSDWEEVGSAGHLPDRPGGLLTVPLVLRDASAIAVDQHGNVFTSNSAVKGIYRIDTGGHVSAFVEGAEGARGLAFGSDGRLYACDHEGIVIYSSDGKKSLLLQGVDCQDIAVNHNGGIYYSTSFSSHLGYITPDQAVHWDPHGSSQQWTLGNDDVDGVCLTPDQSMIYVSEPTRKWVWSFQVEPDGSLGNGEQFYRMETGDESSESWASGLAADSYGLLYVITELGIQVCDAQGRVVAIIDPPEHGEMELGGITKVAFGGPNQDYLYAVAGNTVFRRHLVRQGRP